MFFIVKYSCHLLSTGCLQWLTKSYQVHDFTLDCYSLPKKSWVLATLDYKVTMTKGRWTKHTNKGHDVYLVVETLD